MLAQTSPFTLPCPAVGGNWNIGAEATSPGRFRMSDEESGGEISFDSPIEGKAQRAVLGRQEYFRTFRSDRVMSER
jgi:hypothetical protein